MRISIRYPLFGFIFMAAVSAQATEPPEAPPVQNATVRAYTGEQDENAPEGANFLQFFTPEIGAYMARLTPGIVTGTGQLLEVGGLFTNYPGSVLSSVTQPSGNALVGTFKIGPGGIHPGQNKALLLGNLATDNVNAVAQTGVPLEGLPTGETIKNFLQFDGNGDFPFFFVQLQGTGINGGNSLALCSLTTSTTSAAYAINLLVQARQTLFDFPPIKTITTLIGSKGTFADGRWRCNFSDIEGEVVPFDTPVSFTVTQGAGQDWIGVLLTFTGGSQEVVAIPNDAENENYWWFLLGTGSADNIDSPYNSENLDGTEITSFGLPCFDQGQVCSLVKLAPESEVDNSVKSARPAVDPPTVSATNNVALVYESPDFGAYLISRKGDAVTTDAAGFTLNGVSIGSYTTDPVMDGAGDIAIGIKLKGEAPNSNNAIFVAPGDGTPFLIAQTNYAAPGGGFWASFTSMAYAASGDGSGDDSSGGLFFVGTLALSATNGVFTYNNVGLWGTDTDNNLQLLLRTGDSIVVNEVTRIVKYFVALSAAPGSVGSAHGYDDSDDVAVVCYFTDGTSALVDIAVPAPGPPK